MNELGQLELPKREDYATIEQYAAAFAEYTKQKTEYEMQMDNIVSYFAGEGVRDAKRNDIRNDILTGSNNVRVT
jgi:hypothetical protein